MGFTRVLVPFLSIWWTSAGVCHGQELSATLLWEIGGIDGPEEVMWMRIDGAFILGERVYVVDTWDPSVRQFSIEGAFVAELGRVGGGPGEFVRPSTVALYGDSIGVWDFGQRRWAFFDENGNHLETRGLPVFPQMKYAGFHRVFGSVGKYYAGLTTWVVDDGIDYPQALVQWSDPTQVDTLGLIPQGAIMASIGGQWNRVSQGVGPVGGVDTFGDSLIVFVDGLDSEISVFSRTESGLKTVETKQLPGNRRPLSKPEQDKLVDHAVRGGPPEMARREFRLPEFVPTWSSVNASSEGTVWLRRGGTGEPFGSPETWVAWSLIDGMVGELTLPLGINVLDFEGDRVIGSRRGEFDELYLQLFRIDGAGAGQR